MMTEEEHAQALAELQERNKRPGRDSRDVGGKTAIGTEKDVARAYNEFWFGDKPTRLSYRTSMVVDPPDGRMPPLTAEAARADRRQARVPRGAAAGDLRRKTGTHLAAPREPLARLQPRSDQSRGWS